MSKWTKFGAAVLAVSTIVGCGSDSGGTTSLSQSEKTALTQALANTDFGGLATYVVQVVGKVGTLDAAAVNASISRALDHALSLSVTGAQSASYEGAVGIAMEATYQGQSVWFYGIIGWNGINTSNNTVDEILLVGGAGDGTTLPASASGTIGQGDIFAFYEKLNGSTYDYFDGTSGNASVSASSFSGSTDCSASSSGITIDCSYSTGTMNGSFNFVAENIESADTYTQPGVTFSGLPAVKLTLTITGG